APASSRAGPETTGVGITRSGTGSTSRNDAGGGSNQGVEETKSSYNESGVAGTGPNRGGGSASGIADQVHYSLSDVRKPILSL
ncbi:unnamed protein product, partial [Ectocarpus fasciculatus]